MSIQIWQSFHRTGAAAAFDAEAADRDYARDLQARAAIAEARETAEQLDDAQRAAIEADIAQRRMQLAREVPAAPREWRRAPSRGLADEVSPPAAFEASLEEIVARRINVAGAQNAADRQADRAFLIEVVGQAIGEALGEALEEVHKRIDQLEHELLLARGLLHEHGLAVRSLLPDPADDYAPRTPHVLARAGSRTLTERAANRNWPSSDSTPWFSQPFFNADDT
jgi:hypothetical protein